MAKLAKDFFIGLSHSQLLNKSAKKWGYQLGAKQFVAGTDIDTTLRTVSRLNGIGIACTVDNLGEFVTEKSESLAAKDKILEVIRRIHQEALNCHISVKLTLLGLNIDEDFCLENMKEIVDTARTHNVFVNIDTENYTHYEPTLLLLEALLKEYDNVGTVIQSYLHRAEQDMDQLKNVRLRLVKGAYKESNAVAYQSKTEIDQNFLKLIKKRLKGNAFTSIATHDHHIIDEVKRFVIEEGIDPSTFEFQMLYGFRTELQESLVREGFLVCTYLPFGSDWFGYFMRRLAERPQNISLIAKDKLYHSDNRLKKTPIIIGASLAAAAIFLLTRRKK